MSTTNGSAARYISIVMFMLLSSFQLSVSDTIILRTGIYASRGLIVFCDQTPGNWHKMYRPLPGVQEITIEVPTNVLPARCVALQFSWATGRTIYDASKKSYEACKDKCIVELRRDGTYIWNKAKKTWDLIEKAPIREQT